MTNTTKGSVLRRAAPATGANYGQFFEWPFSAPPAATQRRSYALDNPYPLYPTWAARPLNKPLPYPKLSNADSLDYYKTRSADEGFRLELLHSNG